LLNCAVSGFMCGNLLQYERRQICTGSLWLRFFARPYNGILVCGYELVPCCQVVRINLHLFYLLIVFTPRLLVVLIVHYLVFLWHHVVLAHACLEVERGVGFLSLNSVLPLILLF
jgi:hypothetical protein